MRSPQLEKIKLGDAWQVSSALAYIRCALPELVPSGVFCPVCIRHLSDFKTAWPVVFTYRGQTIPEEHYNVTVFCCTPAHAAQFMMSWFDPPEDTPPTDWPEKQGV